MNFSTDPAVEYQYEGYPEMPLNQHMGQMNMNGPTNPEFMNGQNEFEDLSQQQQFGMDGEMPMNNKPNFENIKQQGRQNESVNFHFYFGGSLDELASAKNEHNMTRLTIRPLGDPFGQILKQHMDKKQTEAKGEPVTPPSIFIDQIELTSYRSSFPVALKLNIEGLGSGIEKNVIAETGKSFHAIFYPRTTLNPKETIYRSAHNFENLKRRYAGWTLPKIKNSIMRSDADPEKPLTYVLKTSPILQVLQQLKNKSKLSDEFQFKVEAFNNDFVRIETELADICQGLIEKQFNELVLNPFNLKFHVERAHSNKEGPEAWKDPVELGSNIQNNSSDKPTAEQIEETRNNLLRQQCDLYVSLNVKYSLY